MESEEKKIFEQEIEKELEQELLFEAIEEKIDNIITEETKTSKKDEKAKKKKKRYRLKKAIQARSIVMMILVLLVNTYAWFIYISKVETSLSIHVRDWKFELMSGSQSEKFDFIIDSIYPGIKKEDTVKEISATNASSETTALLTCELNYVKIFDEEYIVEEGGEYTSKDLLDKISNDYPFKIQLVLVETNPDGSEKETLYDGESEYEMVSRSEVKIRMQVVWPYETVPTGDLTQEELDEIDTYYGNLAHEFNTDSAHDGEYSIVVKMNVKAVQKEGKP